MRKHTDPAKSAQAKEEHGRQARPETVPGQAAQQQLAEAVRQAKRLNANLTALIENTDEFILFSDVQGMPLIYNQAYADVIKDLLGIDMRPGLQPHTLLPEPARLYWEALHHRVLSGEKFSAEFDYTTADGRTRYFEVWFNPVLQNGKVTGFSEFSREITDRKRDQQARQRHRQRIDHAVEEERRRIAGDIHDSVGQDLILLQLALRAAVDGIDDAGSQEIQSRLDQCARTCRKLISDIREICYSLYPTTLQALGLPASLRALADHSSNESVRVRAETLQFEETRRFDPRIEIALYRIAQEAVHNALRHSGGSMIDVRLFADEGELTLSVSDDGGGFDPATSTHGIGLMQMTQRAENLGGSLAVESGPNGTTIRVSLPLTLPG